MRQEINPENNREINPDELIIDNGEDRVMLNVFQLESDLDHCGVDKAAISKIMANIQKFNSEATRELARGVHLGSSQLDQALNSFLWEGNPADFGLKTALEQKLVGKLIEKSCVRKAKS